MPQSRTFTANLFSRIDRINNLYNIERMKTFKDLTFKEHPNMGGLQAIEIFPNGYGVSVIRFQLMYGRGHGSYTSNEKEWELAVIYGTESKYNLVYNTPISDDVLGHLNARQVTSAMKRVQRLKP